MKHKRQSKISITVDDGAELELWVERRLPKGWWKYPSFDFSGIHMPCPYIWFIYWLITWDIKYWKCYEIPTDISIRFLPD